MPPEKQEDTTRQEFEDALDLSQDPYDPGFDDDLKVDEDQKKPEADEKEKAADDQAKETSEKEAEATPEAEEKQEEKPVQEELKLEQEEIHEITLPDGSKMAVPKELAEHEQFKKLVTQDHQVAHYQKLAEERQAQLDELQKQQDQKRQEAIDILLQQQAAQAEQAQQQQQVQQFQRPPADKIKEHFTPMIAQMQAEGRITEEEAYDHGGLIAEQLFQNALLEQKIAQLEHGMTQVVTAMPTQEMFDLFRAQQVQTEEAKLLAEVSNRQGYEDLTNPDEWQKLKDFVAQKIANSPKDGEGNPTFNPLFDADTVCALYDAMMAPTWRAAIQKQRAQAEEDAKTSAKQAAGDSASKAPAKPTPPKAPMTPELDAMTFDDPKAATG
jgi:hypothetical protein